MKNEAGKSESFNLDGKGQSSTPCLYQIVLHNDDYTPMEFVVGMLQKFFYMERQEASSKMLEAHMDGKTVCGLFSKDVAASKLYEIGQYALLHDHPLLCNVEIA